MEVAEPPPGEAISCSPYDSLHRAAQIMWEHDCNELSVVEDGETLGRITEHDIFVVAYVRDKPLSQLPVSLALSRTVTVPQPTETCQSLHDLAQQAQAAPGRQPERPDAVPIERYFWPVYRVKANRGGWEILDRKGRVIGTRATRDEVLEEARRLAKGDGGAHVLVYGVGGGLESEFVQPVGTQDAL